MKGSAATAALLGLVVFPGTSGQSWGHDEPACGLVGCQGAAEAQGTSAFDSIPQRRLHEIDGANDPYDSVSADISSVF